MSLEASANVEYDYAGWPLPLDQLSFNLGYYPDLPQGMRWHHMRHNPNVPHPKNPEERMHYYAEHSVRPLSKDLYDLAQYRREQSNCPCKTTCNKRGSKWNEDSFCYVDSDCKTGQDSWWNWIPGLSGLGAGFGNSKWKYCDPEQKKGGGGVRRPSKTRKSMKKSDCSKQRMLSHFPVRRPRVAGRAVRPSTVHLVQKFSPCFANYY
jgi:hypothetical protein